MSLPFQAQMLEKKKQNKSDMHKEISDDARNLMRFWIFAWMLTGSFLRESAQDLH